MAFAFGDLVQEVRFRVPETFRDSGNSLGRGVPMSGNLGAVVLASVPCELSFYEDSPILHRGVRPAKASSVLFCFVFLCLSLSLCYLLQSQMVISGASNAGCGVGDSWGYRKEALSSGSS